MYEKEFEKFGNIIQIDNLQKKIKKYIWYIDTIIDFKNSKEELVLIYEKYKDDILKMIINSDEIKDKIMIDENGVIRHDKDFEREIDISKVSGNIFQKPDNLNYYEYRARIIILLEIAKLINNYGIKELNTNQDIISKEIRLGIFSAKTDRYVTKDELEKIKHRIELYDAFGSEAIPYIENYDLLKNRIKLLKDFTKIPEEIESLDLLTEKLQIVDTMIEKKDKKVVSLIKQCFSDYERINREMIISRIKASKQKVINNPYDNELLLLHFIPDFKEGSDLDKSDYFDNEAIDDYLKRYIEEKYDRKYNSEIDEEEVSELLWEYFDSRKKTFELSSRFPLKNKYTNDSLYSVITKPFTNLSCSIGKPGNINSHLNRKIALGISIVPINAIKTINTGYNNELDRFSFEKNSVALPEVLNYIKKGGTNETLVDWTQVEFSYILVVKETEKLEEEILKKAEELSSESGLPICVYDSYEMEKQISNPDLNRNKKEIQGAYCASDLGIFTKYESKSDIEKLVEDMLVNEEIGGTKDEQSK